MNFTEFPFGIRAVRPFPTTLTLHAESPARAASLLTALLPAQDPDSGELYGIQGLRIRRRSQAGIELHVAGERTSLWLSGVPVRAWSRAEETELNRVLAMGWQPHWRCQTGWTTAERAWEQRWFTGEWQRQHQAGAWCASGLLRRLALFWKVAAAEMVSGYEGTPTIGYPGEEHPVRWCLELASASPHPSLQEELLRELTDPVCGLPLERATHLDQRIPVPSHMVRLDDPAHTGLVQLTFAAFNYLATDEPHHSKLFDRIRERVTRESGRTRARANLRHQEIPPHHPSVLDE
jgi:hypothetical protein